MEFTINMPYRKITLKVSVAKPDGKGALLELDRLARKQELAYRVAKDVRSNQEAYFLLK